MTQPNATHTAALEVTFQSLGRSRRRWVARFECGSSRENEAQALRVAHNHRAKIIAFRTAA